MPLRYMLWILLAVLLAACNLAESTDEKSLETPVAVAVTVQPTVGASMDEDVTLDEEAVTTEASEPVGVPAEAEPIVVVPVNTGNTTNNQTTSSSTCALRTDLPMYTVVSGDTLYSIAMAYNSTVADLSAYNCLVNNNVISVGQRLYVPATNTRTTSTSTSNAGTTTTTSSPTSNTNTSSASTTNTIVVGEPVPVVDNHNRFDGTTYFVDEMAGVSLSLPTEGLDERLTYIEFVYTDDRSEYTSVSIGIDDDFSDGINVFWTPDSDLQGMIVADGRIPNQMGEVFSSEPIRIESESPMIGPLGEIAISPHEQAGSTTDGSTAHIVTGGETVTITWDNIRATYTDGVTVANVNFFYYPATGGITPIGTDSNIDDGISITWDVPDSAFGGISASAIVLNSDTLISPRIQIRAGDTDVAQCEFVAYGIGGPVPVYGIPNTAVDVLRTMTASETAPVLGMGGRWETEFGGEGTFYHLDFGAITGWVQDGRGGLQGDCEGVSE